MTVSRTLSATLPPVIRHLPFDVLSLRGKDSIDFLQRISTNDFAQFSDGQIRKTLFVSDKGRIIDAVWVINKNDHLLMLVSEGMAKEVQLFLEKYIITDDITVNNVSTDYSIGVHFEKEYPGYRTDYFGIDVTIEVYEQNGDARTDHTSADQAFERWRIENGIPRAKKEIVQDFNPLELDLWSWISFTKGCYIGQEVIARLDTYSKIQRSLCSISTEDTFIEGDILVDETGADIGRITSASKTENGSIGLCVVRIKYAVEHMQLTVKQSHAVVTIQQVFRKDAHGRN